MGKREERRPPESGREPGENTAVAGLIMGIAAVVFWFSATLPWHLLYWASSAWYGLTRQRKRAIPETSER